MSRFLPTILLICWATSAVSLNCKTDADCTADGLSKRCLDGRCVANPSPDGLKTAPLLQRTGPTREPQRTPDRSDVDRDDRDRDETECTHVLDCLPTGEKQNCRNGRCVRSNRQICRDNEDCDENLLRRWCRKNRCTANWIQDD